MLAGGSQRTARRRGYSLLLERRRSALVLYEGVLTCGGELDDPLAETLTVPLSLIVPPMPTPLYPI